MAAKTEENTQKCTFLWRIENISKHTKLKCDGKLLSPSFSYRSLKFTKWTLFLLFAGETNESFIDISLTRETDCTGPNLIEVSVDFSLLKKDGSCLRKRTSTNNKIEKGDSVTLENFVERERVFISEREDFLPEDILTVKCEIWIKAPISFKPEYKSAKTVFEENRRSFVWRIGELSKITSTIRNKFKDSLIDFDLVLQKGMQQSLSYGEKKLLISFNSFNESIKYFYFKTSVIDSEGKKEKCGTDNLLSSAYYRSDLPAWLLSKTSTQLTELLILNKRKYLPNDVLSLDCEFVSSTKTNYHEICGFENLLFLPAVGTGKNKTKHYVGKVEFRNSSNLADDLKLMYVDDILSDMKIRTSTRTFSAHRVILSARSPVFNRMFSSDMAEKNSGHVDITDLEEDTVHRMLLYIYTDSLQDLQMDSALELYAAADKYQVASLKNRCSDFIKNSLRPINVCHVLKWACVYKDDDLIWFVHDYILKHGKEVFCSKEWKGFIDTNPKSAANIMHLKFLRD